MLIPHRIDFAGGELLSGTPEEEAKAEEIFLSYRGPYESLGDKVVHHVKISSDPLTQR